VKCGAAFHRNCWNCQKPAPCSPLVPDFTVALMNDPTAWPMEASYGEVSMRTSSTASALGTKPARPPLVPVTGLPSSRNSLVPVPSPPESKLAVAAWSSARLLSGVMAPVKIMPAAIACRAKGFMVV